MKDKIEIPKPKAKLCSSCGFPKYADQFHKDENAEDGLSEMCIQCTVRWKNEEFLTAEELIEKEGIDPKKVVALKALLEKDKNRFSAKARKVKQFVDDKRPSEYFQNKFYKNCFYEIYKNLSVLDMSRQSIKILFGVSDWSLRKHAEDNEEAIAAYNQAMEELERKLVRLIFVQAMGYEYNEAMSVYKKTKKGWKLSQRKIYTKFQPGNSQMLIFLITNKFPDDWKISKELVHKNETYDSDRKKIESLARDVLAADTNRPEGEPVVQG